MEEVHQDHMKAVLREIPDRISAHIRRLGIVKWCQVMTDIDDINAFIHLQDLSLYGTNKEILRSDIRCQRQYRHGGSVAICKCGNAAMRQCTGTKITY